MPSANSRRGRRVRQPRWRFGLLATLLLAVSLLPVPLVRAAVPTLGLAVGVSPYTGATGTAPVTLTLHMTATPDPADIAYAPKHMTFDLDPNIVTGFQPPPGCVPAQVLANPALCTQIGDGAMVAVALGLTENMTVRAFQSTDPQALLLLVDGQTPLTVHSVLTVHQTTGSAGGDEFDIDVPPEFQQPAPGAYATLTDFNFILRSTIGLVGCPATGTPLRFALHVDFTPGTGSADATAETPCETVAPPTPPPVPPLSVSPPVISGATIVGNALSASAGSWSGQTPMSFTYQWQRCTTSCSAIPGANSSGYTLASGDKGAMIAVTVTAANVAGSAQATSSQVGPVTAAVPSAAQIKAALLRALAVRGSAAKIGQLRKHGGYLASMNAPSAGRLRIGWYLVPKGAHLAKAKHPTLVAAARATLGRAGKASVKIKLTDSGRKLLKRAKRLKLTAKGSFTPTGAKTTTASRTITLKR